MNFSIETPLNVPWIDRNLIKARVKAAKRAKCCDSINEDGDISLGINNVNKSFLLFIKYI